MDITEHLRQKYFETIIATSSDKKLVESADEWLEELENE